MHTYNRLIIKMIHQAVHIISIKAELFAIRCSINQALNLDNMSKVIVITNSIHVARKIFEPSVHPYQVQLVAILSDLCKFFTCHKNNSIEFWKCPSYLKWHLHNEVNKETKTFNPIPLFLCKISWDFSVMECFGSNILFYLFFFWFYISFSLSFSFRTMKQARDKEVTQQVTWCDIISLELDRRVWKMTSGHLEYT